jgi:uncharacterized membrane protein YccC
MDIFNPRGLAFAFNSMIAACAAIALSCWWELPNPSWAALSVFLASTQMPGVSGAVAARALYRFAGTAVGCAAALFIMPAISDFPVLLVVTLALWVAVCVYLGLIDRSPRSYAFMLSGYTMGLVALPVVTGGGNLWDGLLGRVEEIGVGVVCATVAHSVFFPQGALTIARQKVEALAAQARTAILSAFDAQTAASGHPARVRMAQGLAELNEVTVRLRFDLAHGYRPSRVLRAIEAHLVDISFLLGAVEQKIAALRRSKVDWPALEPFLAGVARWMRDDPAHEAPVPDAMPQAGTLPAVHEALVASVVQRTAELTRAWRELSRLAPALGASAEPPGIATLPAKRSLHVDHGKAVFAGVAVGINAAIAACVAMLFDWQQAAIVGIAMAGPANLAFLDDPRPALRLLVVASLVSAPIAAAYIFAIFPAVDDIYTLMAVLAPTYFVIGLFMASPRWGVPAMGFAVIFQTTLALQLSRTSDFVSFTSLAIAVVMSSAISLATTSLYRVITAAASARRIRKIAQSELRGMVRGAPEDLQAWASRMLDRVVLHLPRAGGAVDHPLVKGTFVDARIGVNLLELRDVEDAAPELPQALDAVATHVGTRESHEPLQENSDVIRAVDLAIARIAAGAAGDSRSRALAAAAGLRTTLMEPA